MPGEKFKGLLPNTDCVRHSGWSRWPCRDACVGGQRAGADREPAPGTVASPPHLQRAERVNSKRLSTACDDSEA